MALIALPFILVMPSRQRRAGGSREKEGGWERVKLEGSREIAWPWVLPQPARRLPACLRGLLKDYGDFHLQVTSSNLVQVRDNKGIM